MTTFLTPRQDAENRVFPLGDYLVSFQHRFVCCAIPKNGCTVLKRWFLSAVEPESASDVDVHAICRDRHSLLLHSPETIASVLSGFFAFAFIRDPIKRIASAFTEKFVGPTLQELFEPAREVIEENERLHGATAPQDIQAEITLLNRTVVAPACSAVAYARGITFREFVRYLRESPNHHLDSHWRPQSDFLGGRRFDFVGRVDDLSTALPALARRLGAPAPDLAPPEFRADRPADVACFADMLSSEMHRRRTFPGAASLFDDELREAVLERYSTDAELYRDALPSP